MYTVYIQYTYPDTGNVHTTYIHHFIVCVRKTASIDLILLRIYIYIFICMYI